MAKPVRPAGVACLVLTLFAALGVLAGFLFKMPLLTVIGILPASFYEAYRSEGSSTKLASLIQVLVLVGLAVVMIAGISFNLKGLLARILIHIALPDVFFKLPAILSILAGLLAVILFFNTRGIYTRWLAIVIAAACLAVIVLLAPQESSRLLGMARS